jgi:transcriptional regulator with XRE-family HTH domain
MILVDIKQRRIDLGYRTKSEFARAAGLSIASVSKVEQGQSFIKNMKPEFQQKWAAGLKCDISDLLSAEMPKMKAPCAFPCKCYKIDKGKLEKMLHDKYGDKIGKVKHVDMHSVICREYREYMLENRWNVEDTRLDKWGI